MRIFYSNEAPIDTLLQIAERPTRDGDLVSKPARDAFVSLGWVGPVRGLQPDYERRQSRG